MDRWLQSLHPLSFHDRELCYGSADSTGITDSVIKGINVGLCRYSGLADSTQTNNKDFNTAT